MENLLNIINDEKIVRQYMNDYKQLQNQRNQLFDKYKNLDKKYQSKISNFVSDWLDLQNHPDLEFCTRGSSQFESIEVKMSHPDYSYKKEIFTIRFDRESWREVNYNKTKLSYYSTSTFDNFEIKRLSLLGHVATHLQNGADIEMAKQYSKLIKPYNQKISDLDNIADLIRQKQYKIESIFTDQLQNDKWEVWENSKWELNAHKPICAMITRSCVHMNIYVHLDL